MQINARAEVRHEDSVKSHLKEGRRVGLNSRFVLASHLGSG